MPLTPEQLEFVRKFQKSVWRWKENDDEDLDQIIILVRLITLATLAEIEKDLEPHFATAEVERIEEFVNSIRKHAENLPDGHEMKTAIDGVSKKP
jgi:hypothetical protein